MRILKINSICFDKNYKIHMLQLIQNSLIILRTKSYRKKNQFKTNKSFHFNNHVFSINEKNNANFKTSLKIFINDLFIVIKTILMICDAQRINYKQQLNKTKNRIFIEFKKSLFRDFYALIIFFVLKKKFAQYQFLLNVQKNNKTLFHYIDVFTTIINLSCAHKIKQRFANTINENVLKFFDVHVH